MEAVRERVSQVLAEQFQVGPERITEAASIDDDLRATSLDRVEVVMTLEDEFAIDISDAEAAELRTVADVMACVTANLADRQPPPVALPGPLGSDRDG